MTILVFGDIVGKVGREALIKALPSLKAKYAPDLVIANAENLAHGKGANKSSIVEMRAAGVDVFTSGNHIFDNKGVFDVWSDPVLKDCLIRPYNYPEGTPGPGMKSLEVGGKKVLVLNFLCQVFMDREYPSPFEALDEALDQNPGHDVVLVDLHGEATSERVAFGLYADGRASAVWGTHTHVPTADGRILRNGTAYLTDVGMTGARHSVLGVKPEGPISHFVAGAPKRFEMPEEGPADLNALLVTIGEDGKAMSIEPIHEIIEI